MSKEEPTNLEILEAVQNINKRVDTIENTNTEILQAVNSYATQNDQRLHAIESDIGSMKSDIGSMKSDIGSMKALMVTKDYLDDKLADLKGDLVVLMRKEDAKLTALVDVLQKRKVISSEDAKAILSLQPFPQLYV